MKQARPASQPPLYYLLLTLSGLLALGAVVALLPNSNASWPNIMGYKSVCTFAPGASIACALLAALCCTLRARLVKKTASPFFVPLAVILILAASLGVSTALWASVKAQYTQARTDATASASITASPAP